MSTTSPVRFAIATRGLPARVVFRVAMLTLAAARWMNVITARELAANVVTMLDGGEPAKCIRDAIDHRRRHFGLKLDEHQASACAEAMSDSWRTLTL